MKKSIKIISAIISVAIVIAICVIFFKPYIYLSLATVIYVPSLNNVLTMLSEIILVISLIYVIYKYILHILELFKNKKKLKPVLMILLMILLVAILTILKKIASTFFANIMLPLIYIIGVIVIPLIIIGMIIVGKAETKRKIILTIAAIIVTLGIYILNYNYLYTGASEIVQIVDLFIGIKENENTSEYNLIYLQNYKQKMDENGYIDKFDVENILNIVDHRTDKIIVRYTNGEETIELNNTDNQMQEELEPKLESSYYKLDYEHKNNETIIYIERYKNEISQNQERNEEITLTGARPNYKINNIKANYETLEDTNYIFENDVNVEEGRETTLDSLRILFVFDDERNNYIPYVENIGELRKIKSYKIYSTGMSITLKDGITLNKEDYTIRVNRYDDNIDVKEDKDANYYYKYEPVATQLKDSDGNIVIEFEFGNTYSLKDLKNIEIIF